jgi:hypothetical protein
MESVHRIDTQKIQNFFCCKSVALVGDTLKWELNSASPYDPMDAYAKAPHREFMRAEDDKALESFVKAWGPLWIGVGDRPGESSLPLVRDSRNLLIAWTNLFTDVENSADPRKAAISLLRKDSLLYKLWSVSHPRLCGDGDVEAAFTAEVETSLLSASKNEIADVCEFLIGVFPASTFGHGITTLRTRTGIQLRATIRFLNLLDALYWMVWQDIFHKKPFWYCEVCHRLIPVNSIRVRRFCDIDDRNCARIFHDGRLKKEKRKDPKYREREKALRRKREGRK